MITLLQSVQKFEEAIPSYTKEQYFTSLVALIEQAVEMEDIELTDHLISNHFPNFLTTIFHKKLLPTVELVQPFYLKHPSYLAVFYCLKGHIYHYARDEKNANYYYSLSISYATEYKRYGPGASAMVNFMTNTAYNHPLEHNFEFSKLIPIYKSMQGSIPLEKLTPMISHHVLTAISLKRFDYALSIVDRFEKEVKYSENGREAVQFDGYRAMCFKEQKQFKAAIDMHIHIIGCCLENESHYDFIETAYKELKSIYAELMEDLVDLSLDDIQQFLKEQFFLAPEILNQIFVEDVLNESRNNAEEWFNIADDLLKVKSEEDLSLIVIDCVEVEKVKAQNMIDEFHHLFVNTLQDKLILSTPANSSTMYYVINAPKEELEKKQEEVKLQLANSKQFYHTTLDLLKNEYHSIKHSIEVARATFYYNFLR